MGVFEIRRATERLGNLGGVQGASLNTGAAERFASGARLGQQIASSAAHVGEAGFKVFAAMQEKEDRRQIDAYTNAMNEKLREIHLGSVDGSVKGKLNETIDFKDKNFPTEWDGDARTSITKAKSDLKKELSLTDSQFERAEQMLSRTYDHWQGQRLQYITGKVRENTVTEANKSMANAIEQGVLFANERSTDTEIVTKTLKAAEDMGLSDVDSAGLMRKNADTLFQRRADLMVNRLKADVAEMDNKDAVAAAYDGLLNILETKDAAKSLMGEDLAKAAYGKDSKTVLADRLTSLKAALKADKEQMVRHAENNFSRLAKAEYEGEENVFSKEIMDQSNADLGIGSVDGKPYAHVPPPRELALMRIDNLAHLDDREKLALKDKWNKYYDQRAKFEADQREKHGYALTLGNGQQVWIRAASWGKTDARLEAELLKTDADGLHTAIINDPQGVLAKIEGARATGNISGADYYKVQQLAYKAMNPKLREMAPQILGGRFEKVMLLKLDGKLETKDLEKAGLTYKRDENATSGWGGKWMKSGMIWGENESDFVGDLFDYNKDDSVDYLFSVEETNMLCNTIISLASQGMSAEKIDEAVKEMIAPKEAKYYNMTMEARMKDPTFMKAIYDLGPLPDMIRTQTSAFAGVPVADVFDFEPANSKGK